jgi:ketosteroid isomerase-like protein
MRRWLFTTVWIASLATAACGGGAPEPAGTEAMPAAAPAEDAVAVITSLEGEWVAAILAGDAAAIERLLAPGFVGTTDDIRYTSAEAIEDVRTGTHETLEVSDPRVHVFGDTAVVTFDQTEKSRHGDADFSGTYLFTNVWARQDGTWRAVASHGARLR